MSWVKLSTSILTDPDLVGLTAEAYRTYVNGLAYCGEHLTDGRITPKGLRVIRAESVDELTDCGLWAADGDDYVVRNYLIHQQSREQVEDAREKARQRAEERRKRLAEEASRRESERSSREHTTNFASSHGEVRLQNPEEEEEVDVEETNTLARPAAERVTADEFEQWWALYPKKVDKQAAKRKFRTVRKSGVPLDALMDGLRSWIDEWRDKRTDPKYIPGPERWLNAGKWEDDVGTTRRLTLSADTAPAKSSWELECEERERAEAEIRAFTAQLRAAER
jgi:hypothetical protein